LSQKSPEPQPVEEKIRVIIGRRTAHPGGGGKSAAFIGRIIIVTAIRARTVKSDGRRQKKRGVMTVKVLETDRLVLRRLTVDDDVFILELLNDPSWLRFIGDRGVRTLDDARNYISRNLIAMYERLGFGLYLTELKGEGIPVGICGLIKRDSLDDVDIGFAFLPEFRREGYAYESASAVVEYGKRAFGLKRIVAITSPDNYGSIRVLEKLGFNSEGMVKLTDDGGEVSLFASDF
jgi:RimJ/RimL family protein N-acetyltransferase